MAYRGDPVRKVTVGMLDVLVARAVGAVQDWRQRRDRYV